MVFRRSGVRGKTISAASGWQTHRSADSTRIGWRQTEPCPAACRGDQLVDVLLDAPIDGPSKPGELFVQHLKLSGRSIWQG
jgi:hypothetical protein